jgi:hypothetical protein
MDRFTLDEWIDLRSQTVWFSSMTNLRSTLGTPYPRLSAVTMITHLTCFDVLHASTSSDDFISVHNDVQVILWLATLRFLCRIQVPSPDILVWIPSLWNPFRCYVLDFRYLRFFIYFYEFFFWKLVLEGVRRYWWKRETKVG